MPQLRSLFGISTVWHRQVKEYFDKLEITVSVLLVKVLLAFIDTPTPKPH